MDATLPDCGLYSVSWTMRLCGSGLVVGRLTAPEGEAMKTARLFAQSYHDVVIMRRNRDGAALLVRPDTVVVRE